MKFGTRDNVGDITQMQILGEIGLVGIMTHLKYTQFALVKGRELQELIFIMVG